MEVFTALQGGGSLTLSRCRLHGAFLSVIGSKCQLEKLTLDHCDLLPDTGCEESISSFTNVRELSLLWDEKAENDSSKRSIVHLHPLAKMPQLRILALKDCVGVGVNDSLSDAPELHSLHLLGRMRYKMNGTLPPVPAHVQSEYHAYGREVTERPGLASARLKELYLGRIDAGVPVMSFFAGLPALNAFHINTIDLGKSRSSSTTDVDSFVSWLADLSILRIPDHFEVDVTGFHHCYGVTDTKNALLALTPLCHKLAGKRMSVKATYVVMGVVQKMAELAEHTLVRSVDLNVTGFAPRNFLLPEIAGTDDDEEFEGSQGGMLFAMNTIDNLESITVREMYYPLDESIAALISAAMREQPFILHLRCSGSDIDESQFYAYESGGGSSLNAAKDLKRSWEAVRKNEIIPGARVVQVIIENSKGVQIPDNDEY